MLSMGIPMIISMLLQAFYNIVDSAFVSNMKDGGEAALNALTLKLLALVGQCPANTLKRSAKGELKNSPVDCFLRGKALQVRAFPY